MYKQILIPTDGSEITGRAIDSGVGLAKALGAEIDTICVKEPFPYGAVAELQPAPPQEFFEAQERAAARNVGAVIAACDAAGVVCHAVTVEGLQPWEAMSNAPRNRGCDLLVVPGSHGRERPGLALFSADEMQDVLEARGFRCSSSASAAATWRGRRCRARRRARVAALPSP